MKKISLLLVAVLFSVTSFAQSTWTVDPMHSFLNFSVKHLGISFVDGKFDQYEGTYTRTKEDLSDGVFNFTIKTNSINTGVEMRDNHLRSGDFFDVEKYPTLTFESKSIKKVKGQHYQLDGFITIKGIKKPISFDLNYGGSLKDDGNGNERIGFQAKTTLNRFDFDIAYDPTGQAIAQDIALIINLEFIKNK